MRICTIALVTALSACSKAPAATAADSPDKGSAATAPKSPDAAIAALVGTTPPEWKVERWMNSPPLELAKLRGSVVLVRWWTAGCPFCSTSAPALRTLDETYASRGLRVIGMYHHKEPTPFDPAIYEETAKKFGFTFPVAFDPEWQTFESWLRDRDGNAVSTGWTSITFVLDKRGVIRHVHPGGSYVVGEPAYDQLRAVIERLIAE
jgi:peroxiredoxin